MSQETDWKEKYLSSLERFERLQDADKERIDVLRKGFVRVSLAADGQDLALDEKLAELRTELRSNRDILELEPQITALEELVVALDERRQEELETLEDLIGGSLDTFFTTDMPRKRKSVIKKFQKAVPKLLEGSGNHMALWNEYAEIQKLLGEHIKELEHQDEGEKKGFFQRLFAGDAATETPPVGDESPDPESEDTADSFEESDSAAITDEASPVAQAGDDEAKRYVDSALNQGMSALPEPEDEGEREQLRQRIASVLSGLLKQIDLPEDSLAQRDELIVKIEDAFTWQELPDLLEQAAELVTSTRAKAQEEFEGFLVALRERLQDIQEFLQAARQGEEQSQLNQQKLDDEVRSELKDIRTSVESTSDIGKIKLDIESMVNRIVSVVDEFHSVEKERRDAVYERMEYLSQRMETMEAEANELRDSLEATRVQAMKDALTELPNRQAYNEHIEREYSRWKRRAYPLSLAVCDIDHFKAINDNLGHLRGDKVLKLVARELSRRVRSEDFVARFGGEEFIIVMPDTDEPSAIAAVEKVRAAIEACPFNFNNERIPVTASFGVTSFMEGDTIESCFERADKALYQAKNAGRNQVVRLGLED